MADAPYSAVATVIEHSGELVAPVVGWAETPATRSRGLLGRAELVTFGAFILCGAKQVHTFGMDRTIDVALCDKSWNVLHVARSMRPNRLGKIVLRGLRRRDRSRRSIEPAAGGPTQPPGSLSAR